MRDVAEELIEAQMCVRLSPTLQNQNNLMQTQEISRQRILSYALPDTSCLHPHFLSLPPELHVIYKWIQKIKVADQKNVKLLPVVTHQRLANSPAVVKPFSS